MEDKDLEFINRAQKRFNEIEEIRKKQERLNDLQRQINLNVPSNKQAINKLDQAILEAEKCYLKSTATRTERRIYNSFKVLDNEFSLQFGTTKIGDINESIVKNDMVCMDTAYNNRTISINIDIEFIIIMI